MEKFHGIEFEIPENYFFVDKDKYSVFRNTTIGNINAWLIPFYKDGISKGHMGLIFDEKKEAMTEGDSETYSIIEEYIIIRFWELPYPSISEEEFLTVFKNDDAEPTFTSLKCEISSIPSFSKFSIYNEKKYHNNLTSYSHHFFPSEGSNHRYEIILNTSPHNEDEEASKAIFRKIIDSIKIK